MISTPRKEAGGGCRRGGMSRHGLSRRVRGCSAGKLSRHCPKASSTRDEAPCGQGRGSRLKPSAGPRLHSYPHEAGRSQWKITRGAGIQLTTGVASSKPGHPVRRRQADLEGSLGIGRVLDQTRERQDRNRRQVRPRLAREWHRHRPQSQSTEHEKSN